MKPLQQIFIRLLFLFAGVICIGNVFGQGLNHQWLLGYQTALDSNAPYEKGRFLFDSSGYTLIGEQRKMAFISTQGNISDENGNLLMYSNGCWIANALGDTMMNGTGINPDPFTNQWCNSSIPALPLTHGNFFLPYPGDTSKYILFHETGSNSNGGMPANIYYSLIDITQDSGKGAVIQKNVVVLQDVLSIGMAACKHANGKDWWIVALKDSSELIYKILLTDTGISSVTSQHLNVPFASNNVYQPSFSPDGKKFAYTYSVVDTSGTWWYHDVREFNFDRCTGVFSNPIVIDLTDSLVGLAVAFSPNSKYLYAASILKLFQINTDTSNIPASVQVVAINDTFPSPVLPLYTSFFYFYPAANGKIYITSGSAVVHIGFIDYPDSAGMACNVQQHAIHSPCWTVRGNVYHPNYYLGCDTTSGCPCLATGLTPSPSPKGEGSLKVSPNPNNGNFSISYLLPQSARGGKSGKLELIDVNGKIVYQYNLPPWSTLQTIFLPQLANGVYALRIISGNYSVTKKVIISH